MQPKKFFLYFKNEEDSTFNRDFKLNISFFANNLGNGTLNAYAPIYPSYNNGYTQSFYPKNSIGNHGQITGVSYSVTAGTTLANSSLVEVYLGTTSKDVAATAKDRVPISSLTKVFTGTISVVSGKVTIKF